MSRSQLVCDLHLLVRGVVSLFLSTIWALVVTFSIYMRSFHGSAYNVISQGSHATRCLLFSNSSSSPFRLTSTHPLLHWSILPSRSFLLQDAHQITGYLLKLSHRSFPHCLQKPAHHEDTSTS
ncbi:hypothetical protein BDR07DRAFT_478955 [Suillus spraguei]|nr:hypothetical protein BDR07DRAFT_478955 [Suillus spraguei]